LAVVAVACVVVTYHSKSYIISAELNSALWASGRHYCNICR